MGASTRKERMFRSPHEVEMFFNRRLRFWCNTILGEKQKFVLVAHSFGAYVGTAFAHTVKERYSRGCARVQELGLFVKRWKNQCRFILVILMLRLIFFFPFE